MQTKMFSSFSICAVGDIATPPIEPPCGALAALLLLAGMSPLPRRALPSHPMTAHSGASNCGF